MNVKLENHIDRNPTDRAYGNSWNSTEEGISMVIEFTLYIVNPDTVSFRYHSMAGKDIF